MPVAPVIPSEALGRPVGLFDTGNPSTVGVFSAERMALFGSKAQSLKVGVRRFPDGIGAVVPFGRGKGASAANPPLGLLTDTGRVWFVDADLKAVSPLSCPKLWVMWWDRSRPDRRPARLDNRRDLGRDRPRPELANACRRRRGACPDAPRCGPAGRRRRGSLAPGPRDLGPSPSA